MRSTPPRSPATTRGCWETSCERARHSGSVWLKGMLAHDFFVGGGAVMRGERQGDTQNTFQLPGYVSVDAFAELSADGGPIEDRAADQRHEPDEREVLRQHQ